MFFTESIPFLLTVLLSAFASSFITATILLVRYHKICKNKEDDNEILHQSIEKQNRVITNLTKLYNKALEYDRYKTDFFSNITHELKTPLSVILGTIQLMEKKGLTCSGEPIRNVRYFQCIKLNAYRLLRLVNNILDMARMESGHTKLSLINCNIVYLVDEMTQSITSYAENKEITLQFETDAEEIITAIDIEKTERIILNLLSNAIKFSCHGGTVNIHLWQEVGKVFISVKDTGPGIPRDMHTKIFERFKQARSSLKKESEGTGIGLSLAKCFTELQGGSIKVKSEENQGSEFIVELPLRLCESPTHPALQACFDHGRIIEAINVEFSELYSTAVRTHPG